MSKGCGPGNLKCREFKSRGIILSPGQLYIKASMQFGRLSHVQSRNERSGERIACHAAKSLLAAP